MTKSCDVCFKSLSDTSQGKRRAKLFVRVTFFKGHATQWGVARHGGVHKLDVCGECFPKDWAGAIGTRSQLGSPRKKGR